MKAGLFLMPSHPPERALYDAHQFDLDVIALADELGYQEAWIGEHFTAPWEPIPSPDLMIAQALTRTKNIKLGAGAHLLPYHHPVELALRIAYLDHLAQGRLLVGIGAGGLQTDAILFDVDFDAGENREMTREALEVLLMLWTGGDAPMEHKTKHWRVEVPDPKEWERGYIPMSLGLGPAYIASHWESVLEGAMRGNREPPSRSEWRLVRDVWVADTDEEAIRAAREGMLFRAWTEYLYPLFNYGPYPLVAGMKHDESVATEDIDLEYMLEHLWLVGSPDTVARKIRKLYEAAGGFGVLLTMVLDNTDDRDGWNRSMRLLVEEVLPQVADLTGD